MGPTAACWRCPVQLVLSLHRVIQWGCRREQFDQTLHQRLRPIISCWVAEDTHGPRSSELFRKCCCSCGPFPFLLFPLASASASSSWTFPQEMYSYVSRSLTHWWTEFYPRGVLCQKRPKKIFLLLSLMISSLAFPFVLASVPLRQWGLNPQLSACLRISTAQNSGSDLVPLCSFPAIIFEFPSFTPIFGALLRSKSSSSGRMLCMPRRAAMSSAGAGGAGPCQSLVPHWLSDNGSPGMCILRW